MFELWHMGPGTGLLCLLLSRCADTKNHVLLNDLLHRVPSMERKCGRQGLPGKACAFECPELFSCVSRDLAQLLQASKHLQASNGALSSAVLGLYTTTARFARE